MIAVAEQPVVAEPGAFPAEPAHGTVLTEPERRVLDLFYRDGRSVAFIADYCGCPVDVVRTRLQAARVKVARAAR